MNLLLKSGTGVPPAVVSAILALLLLTSGAGVPPAVVSAQTIVLQFKSSPTNAAWVTPFSTNPPSGTIARAGQLNVTGGTSILTGINILSNGAWTVMSNGVCVIRAATLTASNAVQLSNDTATIQKMLSGLLSPKFEVR